MGVLIVQSRATSHVYRVFGALVVMLLLMALAVGLTRLRSDRSAGSPYGALAALSTPSGPPASPLPPTTLAPPAAPLPVVAQAASASPGNPAAQPAGAPPAPAPPAPAPRVIALDKAAADALVPQPAPTAVVAAAARAAAAPPPPAPASGNTTAVDRSTVAAAAIVPAPGIQDPPAAPAPPSGRVNINTASVEQLNGIGAGHVGAWIARHRPYHSIDELVAHRVLKARDFARIQAAITTD